MPNFVILRGPQATGKSTYAAELETQGYTRINMDTIRKEHPDFTERQVHEYTREMMRIARNNGQNIVHDNVNLSLGKCQSLADWARGNGYTVEMKTFGADVHHMDAIQRDHARGLMGGHSVGRSVIIQTYMDFGFFPPMKRDAIIVDLDGTLCNIEHRLHHVRGDGKKNWGAFFAGISQDTVCKPVWNMVNTAALTGYTILLVSGRGNEYRKVTERWLIDNNMNGYFALFMRPFNDHRPDTDVKREIYHKYIKPYFNVQFAIDDRPSIGRMWRSEGVFTFMVGNGEEF